MNDVEITKYIQDVAINDSEVALERLYNHYYYNLLHFSQIYVIDENDAEEIISDTFLDIWENRKKLVKLKNFNAYIYRIAKFKALNYLRKRNLPTVNLDEMPLDLFARTSTTPEDDCISAETVREINRAIESLPPKCKLAFKLVREDRMSHREAAETLYISVKTLEVHLGHAVQKIREALRKKNIC